MPTLIAEDLLLLLLEDESGKLTNATYVDVGIGGALLVELALGGAVDVVKGAGMWARAKVVPAGAVPADPVLVEAMRMVAEKERTAQDLVARLGQEAARPTARAARGQGDPASAARTRHWASSHERAGQPSTAATRPTYAASSATRW